MVDALMFFAGYFVGSGAAFGAVYLGYLIKQRGTEKRWN